MTENSVNRGENKGRFGCLSVLGVLLLIISITALASGWWVKRNIFASPFTPTHLNAKEQQILDGKLSKITRSPDFQTHLTPEPYREDDAKREITLSEKEVNSLVAKDRETAKRVTIDLADDLISMKVLLPIDEDFPILGGKTVRLSFGVTLRYENGKPVVVIRGVSIGGAPLPGAWWGDIKNKDLVEEFGSEGGFWHQFGRGVKNIVVREGHLLIKLKE
jgi:hypothetical protein